MDKVSFYEKNKNQFSFRVENSRRDQNREFSRHALRVFQDFKLTLSLSVVNRREARSISKERERLLPIQKVIRMTHIHLSHRGYEFSYRWGITWIPGTRVITSKLCVY